MVISLKFVVLFLQAIPRGKAVMYPKKTVGLGLIHMAYVAVTGIDHGKLFNI